MKNRRPHIGSPLLLATAWCLMVLPGCAGGGDDPDTPAAPDAADTAGTPDAATSTVPGTETPGVTEAATTAAPTPQRTDPVEPSPDENRVASTPPTTEPVSTTDEPEAGGAQLAFEGLEHDFGTIWDYDRPACRFEFTNSGDETLVIEAVKAACGCTATTLAKTEYEPGERGAIEVAFTPKGYGSQRKPIDIVSNSTTGAVTRLIVASVIQPFMKFEPNAVRFEQVKLGRDHTQVVELISPDPAIEIDRVEARIGPGRNDGPRGYLAARVAGLTPSGHHRIEVTLTGDMPWGASYGEVNVHCRARAGDGDDDQGGEEIEHVATVGVVATAYGELLADATMFRLSTIAPGESFRKLIHLWRPSKRPFRIVSAEIVQSTMPGLTLRAAPINDGRHVGYNLVLGGPSGDHIGGANGHVRITTDVPGEETLELRFTGGVSDSAPTESDGRKHDHSGG